MIDPVTGKLLFDTTVDPRKKNKDNEMEEIDYDENGKQIEAPPHVETFSFAVGREPREALLGWEVAVRTMRLGEISSFLLAPEFAFGNLSGPLFPANSTLQFDLELRGVTPDWLLQYKTMKPGESIREELLADIHSGKSPMSGEVFRKKKKPHQEERTATAGKTAANRASSGELPEVIIEPLGANQNSPGGSAGGSAGSSASQSTDTPQGAASSATNSPPQSRSDRSNTLPTFFDPAVHKEDPTTTIAGEAPNGEYTWTESAAALDIEIPLRTSPDTERVTKRDLLVDYT